jgi:RecB family exonuclease
MRRRNMTFQSLKDKGASVSTKLTASQLDRAKACPASFALPAVSFPPSKEADRGTEIHRFLETVVTSGREAALEEIPDDAPWRVTCERIDLDWLPTDTDRVECEVKFAYRPLTDTARQLCGGSVRDYSAVEDDEIAGTADLVVTRPDGNTVVIDYKTGWHRVYAVESSQMQLLGLAVARARGLSQVCVSVVHVMEDGALDFDELLLGHDDLDRISQSVRTILSNVSQARVTVSSGQTPDVHVGEHCAFCPAYHACPANISLAKNLLERSDVSQTIPELSPSEAGALWDWATRARQVLEEIEQGLKAYIDNEAVPHPDGMSEIARVESVRESIDGRKAAPVLEAYLGPAADEVIEPSVSKTKLEKFVRAEAPSAQDARAIIQQIMSGLREASAVKETTYTSYRIRPIRSVGVAIRSGGNRLDQSVPQLLDA